MQMLNTNCTMMCCQIAKNHRFLPGRHDGCLGAQWWGRCWSSPRSACPSSTCRCTRRGTRRGSRRWTRSPGSPGAGETSLSSLRLDSIKKVYTLKVGLPKERDGIADLSVTCEGWSSQSPFHKEPVSPTSTITPNEIYLFLSCALNTQQPAAVECSRDISCFKYILLSVLISIGWDSLHFTATEAFSLSNFPSESSPRFSPPAPRLSSFLEKNTWSEKKECLL